MAEQRRYYITKFEVIDTGEVGYWLRDREAPQNENVVFTTGSLDEARYEQRRWTEIYCPVPFYAN